MLERRLPGPSFFGENFLATLKRAFHHESARALRQLAFEDHPSLADIVRDAIGEYLAARGRKERTGKTQRPAAGRGGS